MSHDYASVAHRTMNNVIPLRKRKRQFRRVRIAQPVALVHTNGTVATALASDISQGGLQLRCDRYTIDSLHLSDTPPNPRRAVRLDLHFKLPLHSGLVKVDAECRLIYVVDAPEPDAYLMGVQFTRFHYGGTSVVDRFIKEASDLEANESPSPS